MDDGGSLPCSSSVAPPSDGPPSGSIVPSRLREMIASMAMMKEACRCECRAENLRLRGENARLRQLLKEEREEIEQMRDIVADLRQHRVPSTMPESNALAMGEVGHRVNGHTATANGHAARSPPSTSERIGVFASSNGGMFATNGSDMTANGATVSATVTRPPTHEQMNSMPSRSGSDAWKSASHPLSSKRQNISHSTIPPMTKKPLLDVITLDDEDPPDPMTIASTIRVPRWLRPASARFQRQHPLPQPVLIKNLVECDAIAAPQISLAPDEDIRLSKKLTIYLKYFSNHPIKILLYYYIRCAADNDINYTWRKCHEFNFAETIGETGAFNVLFVFENDQDLCADEMYLIAFALDSKGRIGPRTTVQISI